jgi:ATP-dependent Clp protease ATP-binding subunit ClpC
MIMPSTMERLTGRARKVLKLASKEAEMLDDSMIHSGHFLLGLMQVEGSVSKAVLEKMLPSADALREKMETRIVFKSWVSKPVALRIISLAPELKQSLVYAVEEAKQRGDNFIGTEHLLLGLCRLEENAFIMQILKQLNIPITPEMIRQKTIDILDAK